MKITQNCFRASVISIAGALLITACTPVHKTHGYIPRTNELENIVAGRDTRDSVLNKLGHPSTATSFQENTWYYIAEKTATVSFFHPEVVDRKVVTISFTPQGQVAEVNRYGMENGKVIDLVSRTTPTHGRSLTVLQQVFGNLGRFNKTE